MPMFCLKSFNLDKERKYTKQSLTFKKRILKNAKIELNLSNKTQINMKEKDNLHRVFNITSELTGVLLADMMYKKHDIKVVDSRRIFSYVCVKGGVASLSETSRFMRKSHTNIIFYLNTIHLVDIEKLKKVFMTCQNFVNFDLRELDRLRPTPVKHYDTFKYWDLIFKK